jgi:hypothetical protein
MTSFHSMSDLDALQDFLQSATAELNWLNEKEQVELSRDWADPHINLPAVQHYYEVRGLHKMVRNSRRKHSKHIQQKSIITS